MKVLKCLLVAVVTVSAITVPPTWPRPPPTQQITRRPPSGINSRPHRPNRNTQYNRPRTTTSRSHVTQTTQGDWIPVAPPSFITQHQHYVVHETTTTRPKLAKAHANINIPFSPVTGSRLHLAPKYTPGHDHHLVDSPEHRLPDEDDTIISNYETPFSEHEHPKDIPTRPIYPGEGQWAKPGRKHKPIISTYNYNLPLKDQGEVRPDGYDIFERGQERFNIAQNKYKVPYREPIKHAESIKQPVLEEEEEDEEEKHHDEFVPQKLYAQVRKTETKKHLPRSQINQEEEENADKLREIIKDSKIQTVYSEEGYEDSAYDHAGKEKKAESEEGHVRKGHEAETSGRKSNDRKRGQYSDKRGQNRGRTKHRQTKNKNEFSKIHNYDDTEAYQETKQNVEKELSDSDTGGTSNQPIKLPSGNKVGSRANLHTTKQQKIEIKSTMKNGDDINMEIHTEVKFVNGSDKKKHKFVKIVPSYQRVVEPDTQISYDSNESEEADSDEVSHKRVKRYDKERLSKMYIRKRPNYYWKRKKTSSTFRTTHQSAPVTIKIKSRQKRYTIDYPNIDVPTVKLINIQKPTKNKPLTQDKKFPYLKINSKVLNENSPLRYAENLDNIPKKSKDEMAFYKSRSQTECPDVPDDIDPIPDKIKNIKSNDDVPETDDDRSKNNGPRLEGLGDKIDCLKAKYFGEDPLDSPIFKEEVVSVAIPLIFKKINKKERETKKKLSISLDEEIEEFGETPKKSIKRDIKTIAPIIVPEEDSNTTTNPIIIQRDAVLKPPYTLQEIANKLLKNKTGPNSIYDQINLLAIPNDTVNDENTDEPNFLIVYENQSGEPNTIQNDQVIENKIKNINITNDGLFDPQLSDIVTDLSNYSKELPNNEIINLVPDNFSEYDLLIPLNDDQPEVEEENIKNENETSEIVDSYLPSKAALRDYRYFSQFADTYKPSIKDNFKINTESRFSSIIFDISKYLPQIKNHKSVTSEVQYKEDIKPSEQLNVYSDVLRAINISTQEEQSEASEVPQPITVKLQISNNTRNRNSKRKIKIKTTTVSPIVDLLTKQEDSTPVTSNNIKSIKKGSLSNINITSPQIFPTDIPTHPKTLPNKIRTMLNQYTNPLLIKVPDTSQESTEISGLAPPPSSTFKYRTLPMSTNIPPTTKIILKPITVRQPRQNVNLFFVTGLRPPSVTQQVMNYNDFNNIKRNKRHLSLEQEEDLFTADSNIEEVRVSRKPIMYTQIVRQRNPVPQNDDEEDEEDLLPRKRTYDIKPRQRTTTTEESINEEEYYEVEEPAVQKPIKTQPVFYEKPTGLPEYIKLIDKLHEYRFVNNITTTLPEQETTTANPRATTTTTAKTQTTAESINMGVPAFLQIINALHDTQKQNEQINKSNREETEDEEEEEENDENERKPVQNSNPYISSALISTRNGDDKDEEDVQTHIRNLSNRFRTSIDTSKYKTIERAPIVLRHNFSSRYNADEEILPLERIFTTKMPAVYTTTIRNEEKELILQREHSPETKYDDIKSESEESTISTTTKATRRRMRPFTRPTTTTSRTLETTTRSIVRRRRPQRVQTTSTEIPISTSSLNPVIRRRLRQRLEPQTSIKRYVSEVPPNHKKEYVPVTEIARNGELKEDFKRPNEINKNTWKKLYDRRVVNYQPTSRISNEETNDKKEEFEIIGEIKNPNMKHGGNYRHIDEDRNEEDDIEDKPTSPRNRFTFRRRQNINRSTEPTTSKEILRNVFEDIDDETIVDQEESPVVHKPKIIKDPSKRMYFYAKL